MQPLAWPGRFYQIIVTHPREHVATDVGRVHDNVHVLFDRHRLVTADERPLDKVVALTVAVKALLLRPTVAALMSDLSQQCAAKRTLAGGCRRIRGQGGNSRTPYDRFAKYIGDVLNRRPHGRTRIRVTASWRDLATTGRAAEGFPFRPAFGRAPPSTPRVRSRARP